MEINNYKNAIKKRMFFPCDKNFQIKNSLERLDILIRLMDLPKRWVIPQVKRQVFLEVGSYGKQNVLTFDLNKNNHVLFIRIFCSGLEGPHQVVKVNKRNLKEVLQIINEFEILI